jgi:membrane protein implicated in regulation of membrane protease activity
MTPFVTFALALVLGLAVAAMFLFGGAPLLVLPIIVVAVLAFWFPRVARRARRDRGLADHREQAKVDKVEFTERDRQTLTR